MNTVQVEVDFAGSVFVLMDVIEQAEVNFIKLDWGRWALGSCLQVVESGHPGRVNGVINRAAAHAAERVPIIILNHLSEWLPAMVAGLFHSATSTRITSWKRSFPRIASTSTSKTPSLESGVFVT